MADHEDYQQGEAPAAHKVSHQNDGDDEMSVAGLEGETAELAIHAGLATVHQDAPNLILTHKGDAGAHHAKYTNANAVTAMGDLGDGNPLNHDKAAEWGATEHTAIGDAAPHHAKYTDIEAKAAADVQIGIHTGLPTVHQDAPALIETHRLVPGAHHAKYTNAEAQELHSPHNISPADFLPYLNSYDYKADSAYFESEVLYTAQYFMAPLHLPHGVEIKKMTLYAYRDDEVAEMSITLRLASRVGVYYNMAILTPDWTDRWDSLYTTTISYSTIDNSLYTYIVVLTLYPNDAFGDVKFSSAKIEFEG